MVMVIEAFATARPQPGSSRAWLTLR